jgi:hypothetical protein
MSGQVAERMAQARRALHLAESKMGALPVASLVERAATPPRLRLVSTQVGGRSQCTLEELRAMAAPLIHQGSTVRVTGSLAALFAVAASAWGPEDWGVIANLPDAGLLAAAQAGIPLSRCLVVPDLGAQPVRVLAGLVDACGVVVMGPIQVGAGDRRRLEARLRRHHGRLITAGRWGGAQVSVAVEQVLHEGLGVGDGAVAPGVYQVALSAKGSFGSGLWDTYQAARQVGAGA